MPAVTVWFIDTSVLTEILRVPGKSQRADEVEAIFNQRYKAGDKFVIPITTLIETGNHVVQCAGDRRGAAERFVKAVEAAMSSRPPWIIREVEWAQDLLSALIRGGATGSLLVDLLGDGRMGVGDVVLLVERDEFRARTAYQDVRVWTLEDEMGAYA